jgi:hypothetical protein
VHKRRRWWRWGLGVLGLLAVVLIAARLMLPYWIEGYVNRTLDRSPDYTGSVGDINVHLWRGAYTIHDIQIDKRTHAVPVPFFESPRVDFSLSWHALWNGQARGKIEMDSPRLNFVQGPSSVQSQTGANQPWLSIIDDLYPFRIDRAVINNGEVHFEAFHKDPQVDVYLSGVEATLENLTNVQDKTDPLIATIKASGTAMDTGSFEFSMSLDPESRLPSFDMATRLLNVDVRKLNALALAYGDFDFEQGLFDLVVEMTSREGHVEGYVKPLFRDVRVLSIRDVRADDPLQLLWETLVGVVGAIFKNQARDQFGTRITLVGDLSDPHTSLLEIVGNVLRNAFVRAYLPRIEGRVAPGELVPDTDVSR